MNELMKSARHVLEEKIHRDIEFQLPFREERKMSCDSRVGIEISGAFH